MHFFYNLSKYVLRIGTKIVYIYSCTDCRNRHLQDMFKDNDKN